MQSTDDVFQLLCDPARSLHAQALVDVINSAYVSIVIILAENCMFALSDDKVTAVKVWYE